MLGEAVRTGQVAGIEVTIFNPALDRDGSIARDLVACLASGLVGEARTG